MLGVFPQDHCASKKSSVSNIHYFCVRFPWRQDDLDAPVAPADEELNEQNDDISHAGQV